MNRQSFVLVLAIGALLPCVYLSGCGNNRPATYAVEGRILFEDGSSPKFGNIEFFSLEHKLNARGKIQKDGSFQLTTFDENDGAVIGRHKIVIMQFVSNQLSGQLGVKIQHNHGDLVDKKYLDYRTSDLKWTIKSDGLNKVKLVVEKR